MKKQKQNKVTSVALFDDEPTPKPIDNTSSTKQKKTSEKPKQLDTDKQSRVKKKSPDPVKNENVKHNNKHNNSTVIDSSNPDNKISSKEVSTRARRDKRKTEDTQQQSKHTKSVNTSDAKNTKDPARHNQTARKSVDIVKSKPDTKSKEKQSECISECLDNCASAKEKHRKSKTNNRRTDVRDDKPEREVKGVKKLKRKYETVDSVPAPMTITGKPIPVINEPFLVEITVNGEKRNVSEWSVKNGVYHPGLDSEFLVHCLRYDTKTSAYNSDNDGITEFNKLTKSKYKTWEEASHYQKLTEKLLMEFGDKLHWDILFAEQDMDRFSDKAKKKFKSRYAFQCTMVG